MRKALIGILMAATVATPVSAAPGGWRQRGGGGEQRAEQQQQRQEQRVERRAERQAESQSQTQSSQPVARQSWQGRGNRGGGQVQQQQVQQVQVQQAQPTQQSWQGRGNRGSGQTQQSWQGRNSGGQTQQSWQGRGNDRDEAYRRHIESTREASRQSAAEGSPALQRRAAQNQANYERRLREQRRDGSRDGNWDRNRNDGRDWNRDGRRDVRSSWNRGWRNDNRYDWQRYRYSNRNIFSRGTYYAPYRNHRYNRLSIGLFLGSAFFGQNYWLNDPWQYRLPPAYPGTRWVRYYDDVLLIDVYSGEVIDVIYDFFW